MTDSMRSPGSTVAGRYQLVRPLAKGGMASVHLGHDRVLDRPVAVKILHSNFAVDPVFVDRFRREAQAAGRLNHPRIVAVYDWGEHGDSYYIAMEYAEGRTLAQLLAETGPASFTDAVNIAIDVLDALDAAHARGLVHRDIKPSNLIVGPTGTKVADFGITRAYKGDIDATDVGSVIGTASYMSPEQAQGLAVDPRSDLYSVGVVLFEMVAGRKPFVADSPVAIAYQHIDEAPPKVTTFRSSVPPQIEATIDRLLEKAPDDRFSSAAEVRDHLVRARAGRPPIPGQEPKDDGADARTAVMARPGPMASNAGVPDTAGTAVMAPGAGSGGDGRQTSSVDERVPSRPGRRGLPVVALAVLVAVAFGLLIALASQIGGGGTDGAETGDTVTAGSESSTTETTEAATVDTVPAPDVVGETRSEAERILGDLGLRSRIETTDVDDADLDGRVVSQRPAPDESVAVGDAIVLVVGSFDQSTTTTGASSTTTTAPETTTTSAPTSTASPTTAAATTTVGETT